jgi:hypothetical protein
VVTEGFIAIGLATVGDAMDGEAGFLAGALEGVAARTGEVG